MNVLRSIADALGQTTEDDPFATSVLNELFPPSAGLVMVPPSPVGVSLQTRLAVAERVEIPPQDREALRKLDAQWLEQFRALNAFAEKTPEALAAEAADQAGTAMLGGNAPKEPVLDAEGWRDRREGLIRGYKAGLKATAEKAFAIARPLMEAGADEAKRLMVEAASEEKERCARWGLPFVASRNEVLLQLRDCCFMFQDRMRTKPSHGTRPGEFLEGLLA